MKKIFCLILVLCLVTPLSFGQPLQIERQNYIVQQRYNLFLVVPSLVFSAGAGWFFSEAGKPKNNQAGMVTLGFIFTFTSLVFLDLAFTPEEIFLVPKMDEYGTIWFEKEIRW